MPAPPRPPRLPWIAVFLVACGAEATPKPLSARIDAPQQSAQADVFGTLPDAAPPGQGGPFSIAVLDASPPSTAAVDPPADPPRPTGKCDDGRNPAKGTVQPVPPARPPSLAGDERGDGWNSGAEAPPPLAPGTRPFDRGAAAAALGGVDISGCARPDGPRGLGHVKVTFAECGNVTVAEVAPPFGGTGVGGCIVGKFRSARIPVFIGGPVTVGKAFSLR